MLSRRAIAFLVLALAAAFGFVRLGFWQLQRLDDRRAANAAVSGRLERPATSLEALLADTANARYRRVRISGIYDYDHEFVLTARTRLGAPGANLVTPLRLPNGRAAILVNRGWVYAADGMTIDGNTWREDSGGVVEGFVESFTSGPGPAFVTSVKRGVRRLEWDSIAARVPYPLAPVLVVQQLTRNVGATIVHPHRVPAPRLDEGSHRSYALQWFAFAAITLVGAGVVLRRELGSSS
ncbi:MAG: SURF1 family protein [Gemmatimonadaceae bacterium]